MSYLNNADDFKDQTFSEALKYYRMTSNIVSFDGNYFKLLINI